MHTYCNQPKTPYTPETTSLFIEIFNPYFIAISCMKNKEILKRPVLSGKTLFTEIEELDFTATNRLWPELIVNTLKMTKNLKVVTMSHALLTPEIVTHLNNNKLLEKVVVPELSRYVNMNHLKEFFQAHPHLKEIVLDEPKATALSAVAQKDLESFECMNSVLAADLKPGELDSNALAWFFERKNLKKLRVKPGLSMTGDSTAKLASVIPQIEELSILSAEQGCVVEPLEPILALKNLTHLALPRNNFKQQQLALTGPLKLKQLSLKHVTNCSPKVLATIIKSCPDLEVLNVSKSVFYDDCFLALAGCPKLQVLRAKQTYLTAEGTKAIAKCKNLRQLAIGCTSGDPKASPSTEENFAYLTPILPNLEMLDLSLYQLLTNSCVNTVLTTCKKLQKLKLPPTIGDQAFAVRTHSSTQTLTHLDILGTAVTDVGMSIIINHYPNIKVLQSPSNITINTFKRLHRWTHLQRVVVRETTQHAVGIPNLQLGLSVWSLMLNTATESKTVLVEYASLDPKNKKVVFIGCLGGVRLNMEANIDLVTKILQLTPA